MIRPSSSRSGSSNKTGVRSEPGSSQDYLDYYHRTLSLKQLELFVAGLAADTTDARAQEADVGYVFSHMPAAECMTSSLDCTDCHFQAPFRAARDQGCMSLYRLFPEDVISNVLGKLFHKTDRDPITNRR